jgi:murein DD-endopeptidase MepM/ murein hydrolase activator NlpD
LKALLLLPFLALALGASLSQLQQEFAHTQALEVLQRQRIAALNQALSHLSAQAQQNLAELKLQERELGRLEQAKARLQAAIDQLNSQIQTTQGKIASLEAKISLLKEKLQNLEVSLYEEQAGHYLPLFQASSFLDLQIRAQWLADLGAAQTQVVSELLKDEALLQHEEHRLVRLAQNLNRQEVALQAKIVQLDSERAQTLNTIARLRQERLGQQALLRESLQAEQALEAELNQLSQAIAAERKKLAEEHQPPLPKLLSGKLRFPVPGGKVIEPFGANGNTYQAIQAPKPNSPVIAAASGVVLQTLYIANLGWTVVLQNSQRLATVYINLQQPLVHPGERVEQGEELGVSGGSLLLPPDQVWFSVGIIGQNSLNYVDPSSYY